MEAGLAAEFAGADDLLIALAELRRRGYTRLDAFVPHPVPGLEEALALRRSRLPWLIFPIGLGGASFAFTLQWYCNAYAYPLNVGGRPAFAIPAFVPITFETMVLFSGFGTLLLLFVILRLPRLSHPVFEVEGFERASIDRFYAAVDQLDPKFDLQATRQDLFEVGALGVSPFGARP
jgi:hypothetical protein